MMTETEAEFFGHHMYSSDATSNFRGGHPPPHTFPRDSPHLYVVYVDESVSMPKCNSQRTQRLVSSSPAISRIATIDFRLPV